MQGYGQYNQGGEGGYGQPPGGYGQPPGGYGQPGGYGPPGGFGGGLPNQPGTEYPPYVIKTKLSGRCLDICQSNDHGNHQGDLIIYDYVGSSNQMWQIAQQGADIIFRSLKSGRVLDGTGDSSYTGGSSSPQNFLHTNDLRVRENDYNGSMGQKWRIVETTPGSGQYYIYHSSGKALDVMHSKGGNNTPVIPYNFHGKDNQIWTITKAQ